MRGRRGARSSKPSRSRPRDRDVEQRVAVLHIDAIAAGGAGVGRLDGMAVFVPRTAPGDTVQAAITVRGRFGTARVLQILTPSPLRVEPICRHYEVDRCGGCQLQHLEGTAQQEARRHIVQASLQRIGRRAVPLPPLHAEQAWGYRGRLTLTLVRRRGGWIGGLHPHDDPTRVFALEVCPISQPVLVQGWQAVRALLGDGPAFLDAPTVRLGLRVVDGDGVAVVVDGGHVWPDGSAWAAALQAREAAVRHVWWRTADGVTQALSAGDLAIAAPLMADVDVTAPTEVDRESAPDAQEALAFAQVNQGIATALQRTVLDAVQSFSPRRVVDAYAGVGGLTMQLATSTCHVTAIEADAAGVAVARQRILDAGVASHAEVVHGFVEAILPTVPAPEVLVVNPPRRGVDAAVCQWLESPAAAAVRGVVYVSCDPATLGRDLSRLPSWRVRALSCFDMFPQTAHVETVCVLEREHPSASAVPLSAPRGAS